MFQSASMKYNGENDSFSAIVKVDQVTLLHHIESSMSTSSKLTCSHDVVFEFTKDLASVIESGLSKDKLLSSHLNYIRETMHVVRANKKQPFVCGWAGIRNALEQTLNELIKEHKLKSNNISIDLLLS